MAKSDKRKKIGIFGGTFNPIHTGHLINIEFVRDYFNLNTILMIPAKIPVHKELHSNVSSFDRLKMVELAIINNPFLEVSSIEIDRDSPSYSITTINRLYELYPDDELFLILGSDSFNRLDTWKSYSSILEKIKVIVMTRLGNTELRQELKEISSGVFEINNPLINISSTIIRERIKYKHSIRYLTPDEVVCYIYEKELYKN